MHRFLKAHLFCLQNIRRPRGEIFGFSSRRSGKMYYIRICVVDVCTNGVDDDMGALTLASGRLQLTSSVLQNVLLFQAFSGYKQIEQIHLSAHIYTYAKTRFNGAAVFRSEIMHSKQRRSGYFSDT